MEPDSSVKVLPQHDSTVPHFLPWWDRCDQDYFRWQLARYRRALRFCRGSAADLRPLLLNFIRQLEAL